MEIKAMAQNLIGIGKKYRHALLILLLGVVLMLVPKTSNSFESQNDIQTDVTTGYIERISLEDKLSSALSMMDGAGIVKVILTTSNGEEVIYQTDDELSKSENASNNRFSTVTVTDAERNQTGLIKQVNPEVYKGAIILCSGADNSTVRWELVNAVSRLTGLGTNHISVLKMK